MAFDPQIDYARKYAGSPAVGDVVEFDQPYDGHAGGEVLRVLEGTQGPILEVQIGEYEGGRPRAVDTFWQRARVIRRASEG
jgi:hypothetical protein